MGDRLEPGIRLGRHRIEKLLGAGGMGEAYLATDEVLDVPVVLKVLSEKIAGQEAAFARFKREVLLSRKIAHPGVCKVFDLHQEEGLWFLTMEWVEGETLEAILEREGKLPVGEAARITLLLCDALTAAHEAGVVHRDLKPANIMMRPDRELSILDFGLATGQDQQQITRVGTFVGTAHYVAPEVAQGRKATARSDLYAVGALLYGMVTGQVPFDGDSLMDICRAVIQDEAQPPTTLNPEVEPDLERVILKAMSKEPADRYGNVVELQAAVEAASLQLPDSQIEIRSGSRGIDSSATGMEAVVGYSAVLRAQQRKTTLLFSDIVEITPFFDRYGDIEGRKKIHAHNQLLFPIIEARQGRVVKTIGDAIMAVFELPDEGLEAAIEMQEALHDYNTTVENPDYLIDIRIGLNSGEAIVEEDDVYGDAVNVASRVSSQAVGGQILVAQPTVDSLEMVWDDLRSMGAVALKGKAEPIRIYELIWADEEDASTFAERPVEPSPAAPPSTTDRDHEPVAGPGRWLGVVLGIVVLAIGIGWAAATFTGPSKPKVTSLPRPPDPTEFPRPPVDPVAPPAPIDTTEPTAPLPSEGSPSARSTTGRPFAGPGEKVAEKMRRRGLLPADDAQLLDLLRRLRKTRGRKARTRLQTQAEKRIDAILIDGIFVMKKIRRLEKRARSRKHALGDSRLGKTVGRARQAVVAGEHDRANRLVNLGFELVGR